MDLGLVGKRALITGSTRGIGLAIARTLVAEGASVGLCGRNADDVARVTTELDSRGTAVGAACDVGDLSALRNWVVSTGDSLGGIDIYVHATSAKATTGLDDWTRNFDVDLRALVAGVTAAEDALAVAGGAVVSVGTTAAAEHFMTGSNGYTAMKAAMINWTLGQAQVLGAKGIRCNVVSPGPTWDSGGTWDAVKSTAPAYYAGVQAMHPGGDLGTPQDVANVVAFLASSAARHVNGVHVTVDGGFLKRVDY